MISWGSSLLIVTVVSSLIPGAPTGIKTPWITMAQDRDYSCPEVRYPNPGLGTKEIPRSDGATDKFYFSVSTPEEEEKAQLQEKEREDRSWDLLHDLVIENRKDSHRIKTRGNSP